MAKVDSTFRTAIVTAANRLLVSITKEKRSIFIEHLLLPLLKTYRNKNEGFGIKHNKAPFTVLSHMHFIETKH